MRLKEKVDREVAEHTLLRHLDEAGRKYLLARSTHVTLDAGEILYTSGHRADQVYVLLTGVVQIEYPSAKASRGFVAALHSAPGFLGEPQVLYGKVWNGTGVAMFPTTALSFNARTFEQLLMSSRDFARVMYLELAWRFLGAIDAWKHQQRASPELVLARYVLSYDQIIRKLNPVGPWGMKLSQVELGRATGHRRETINRILRAWERKGVVELSANRVSCLHREVLEKLLPEGAVRLLVQALHPTRLARIIPTGAGADAQKSTSGIAKPPHLAQ